jgi:hypothetical protein
MTYLFQVVQGAAFLLAAALCSRETAQPASGQIERVASLATPRAAHTASALRSGQLLVAGGMGSDEGSYASTEIVDPSTGRAQASASMAYARAGHTAITLRDDRVVMAGGYNGSYLNSVEVFDPSLQRFQIMGLLTEGRSGHTATLLHDNRILIVGGVGHEWSFLSSAELFDPRIGRSEQVGGMSVARESHTATLLPDGRVLIVGGHRGRRQDMVVHSSVEIYDPAKRRFQPAGHLGTPRHKHDAVLLADGRVLVLGGADRTDRRHYATTEVCNPATARCEPGPSMLSTRYKFQGTVVPLTNGDLLVSSGARDAEILDHRSFTFRKVTGQFPAPYFFASATRVPSGDVAIVGGYDPRNRNTSGVWLFRAGR